TSRAGQSDQPAEPGPQQRESDMLLRFALDTVKITLMTLTAAFGVYLTFVIFGALLDDFIAGKSRIFASLIIALLFPVLSAVSETTERERFQVVRRRVNRIARALLTTTGLTFASSALILMTLPGRVIGQLRTEPNWFLSTDSAQSTVASINERVSLRLADILVGVTTAVGVYDSGSAPDSPAKPPPSKGAGPPPSTRPPTPDDGPQGSDEGAADDRRQPRSAIELMNKSTDESDKESTDTQKTSDDEANGPSNDDGNDEYEKW
ncbi:MAG: hypothetical protein ABEN55_12365, partial [Bradymonadaceae bacterium]